MVWFRFGTVWAWFGCGFGVVWVLFGIGLKVVWDGLGEGLGMVWTLPRTDQTLPSYQTLPGLGIPIRPLGRLHGHLPPQFDICNLPPFAVGTACCSPGAQTRTRFVPDRYHLQSSIYQPFRPVLPRDPTRRPPDDQTRTRPPTRPLPEPDQTTPDTSATYQTSTRPLPYPT